MILITHTFKALLREKILYNVFAIACFLFFVGYLASQLVFGNQDRVMLNLGFPVNAFAVFAVSIGVGARYLTGEIASQTIYLTLYRVTNRTSYYAQSFIGMYAFVLMNLFILTLLLMASVKLVGGKLSVALIQSFILTAIEAGVLLSMSMFFCLWLRPALVWIIGCFVLFLGHNKDLVKTHIPFINAGIPNLQILLMSDRVYYQEALSGTQFGLHFMYGALWLLLFLLVGNKVFSKKNL